VLVAAGSTLRFSLIETTVAPTDDPKKSASASITSDERPGTSA
jgi:hypothetical protein